LLIQRAGARAHVRAWPWTLLALAALATGIVLRLWQLRSQMLVDDEWHSVRMLVHADMATIATHFGIADYCIPLTLFYRWLYQHAALDEWWMHLPLLLAGVATLVVLPALLRCELPAATRAMWTALLAISPPLVYFSRTARPYALTALLGFFAIVAFNRWHARAPHRRAWAAGYLLASALAAWLHLLTLVFTLWPFAHYGARALWKAVSRDSRSPGLRGVGRLFVIAVPLLVLLALLLGPPLAHDWQAMAGKAAAGRASAGSLWRSLLMALGTGRPWVGIALAALSALGAVRLWRREPDLSVLVFGAMTVGAGVICAVRPAWIEHAPVLVRYCAPVLPWLLLCVAEGIVALLEPLRDARIAALAATGVLSGTFLAGPVPGWLYVPNQFMDHAIFQFDYDVDVNPYAKLVQLGPVSPFYLALARQPAGSLTLVETPARAHSNYMPDPWLQRIHRQNVEYALASPVCGVGEWDEYPSTATGDRFRRIVRLSDILSGTSPGADYLVIRRHPWSIPPAPDFPLPLPWPDMDRCIATVARRLGGPVYEDAQLTAFALKRTAVPPR
jgi:hypothetical protein